MDPKVVKSKPLSKEETKALLELIENSKIITSKTTNATSNKLKDEEWYRITEKFNATATSSRRLPQQLRLKWENLKKNARKRSTKIRMNNIKTGGGVRDYIPPDEVLDRVANFVDKEPETFDVRTSDGECGSGMEEMGGDAQINLEILGFQDAPMLDPEVMNLTPKIISEPGSLPETPRRVTFNIPKAKAGKRKLQIDGPKAARDLAVTEYFKYKKLCLEAKMSNILLENEKLKLENEKLKLEISNLRT